MYQIEENIYFYLILVIPLMILGNLFLKKWRKKKQSEFFNKEIFKNLSPLYSDFKSGFKVFLLSISLFMISIGLVNPKIGTQLKTVKREGVDIVFAIDVSKSMLAEDIAPSRLEKAKRLASEIINNLESDRVGIIAYAATAIPVLPITSDYSTARMFLQSLNSDMLSSQGTAVNQAINLSEDFFDDENQTNRVLCLLSDGEDHEFSDQDFSDVTEGSGITIFSIGLGSNKGAPIPIRSNGVIESYKKNQEGDVVITKLMPNLLKELSKSNDGFYMKGDNTEAVVDEIISKLKQMDKKEFESKQFVAYKDQFQWFIGFALFFLCLEMFVFAKKTIWLEKLNLFNENSD